MGSKDLHQANEIAHLVLNPPFYFRDWLLIKRKLPYLDPTTLYRRERERERESCDDGADRGAAG